MYHVDRIDEYIKKNIPNSLKWGLHKTPKINFDIRRQNMKKILKVKDVKEILGCGINRAYDIVNQKDFPKVKIGKRVYILEDEFEEWLRIYTGKEYEIV